MLSKSDVSVLSVSRLGCSGRTSFLSGTLEPRVLRGSPGLDPASLSSV